MLIKVNKKDQIALDVAQRIKKLGYKVEIISDEERVYPGEVAIFSVNNNGDIHFPGKHGRLAAHRLFEAGVVPKWADTPFVVAFRPHPNPKTSRGIDECIKQFIKSYQEWFAGIRNCACPWGCEPTGEARSAFEQWRKTVAQAFLTDRHEKVHQLLSYFSPLDNQALREVVERINICREAVSALCLHADEERQKIVSVLNGVILGSVRSLIKLMPFEKVKIFSFSPQDEEVLSEWKMESIVLPSIWGNKKLEKHWQLCRLLEEGTEGKVEIVPIRELFQDKKLVEEAWDLASSRGGRMFQKLRKNPPPVFRKLSTKQQKERLAAEAVLYLLMTAQYSESIYLGFEVHAEYWRSGKLYQWGDKFLPVIFAPYCLRQHWGDWAMNSKRKEEILRLELL